MTSAGASDFKWLIGYFDGDFSSSTDLTVLFPDAIPVTGTGTAFIQVQLTKIVQNSFFGEVSYPLTPKLKATAGVRRFSYDSSLANSVSGFASSTGSNAVLYTASDERDGGINPKFDLSYEADKNLLLYATIAKGFRPGGGKHPVPTSGPIGSACEANLQANHGTTAFVAAPLAFAPDNVRSYEFGEKARMTDSRLTVISAVYFEKWNGVQQNIPLPCGFPYADNSGEANIYRGELIVVLAPGLVQSANAGYTNARFVVGSLATGITAGHPSARRAGLDLIRVTRL